MEYFIYFLKLVRRLWLSFSWFYQTIKEVITGRISIKYGRMKILSQLTLAGRRFDDGVNWKIYSNHYLEELKIIQKTNTTVLRSQEAFLDKGEIKFRSKSQKPLLAGHKLLYETIIDLNPKSILEVGCGAGDHLANLKTLNANFECYGTELLSEQINLLNIRHPENNFILNLSDITSKECELPRVELVYANAVLMHITEKKQRFQIALTNLFTAANNHIVLIENWTQHNFYESIQRILHDNPQWKIYFRVSDNDDQTTVVVISKSELAYKRLMNYNALLLDKVITVH